MLLLRLFHGTLKRFSIALKVRIMMAETRMHVLIICFPYLAGSDKLQE